MENDAALKRYGAVMLKPFYLTIAVECRCNGAQNGENISFKASEALQLQVQGLR